VSGRVNNLRTALCARRAHARGFTLLEVMISLMVLAIGVMGVIGLQTSTYKQLQTSQNLSKAAMLASGMADRMLANEAQVIGGAYTHKTSPTSMPNPNCASAACTPIQLAAYDVWAWQAELLGIENIDEKVPGSLPKASGAVEVVAGEYIVRVRWDDDLSGSTGENCPVEDPVDLDCYTLNLGCLGACP